MADLSDVTAALRKMVAAALYPGQATPSGNSIAGMPVLIQSGWPDPASLTQMIAAAKAQVTVYPRPIERNVTRYPRTWQAGDKQAKTFSLSQNGQQITVAGAQPGTFYRQNICVFVNRRPYIFSTGASDGANSIAAGLAALIVVDVPGASSAGAVLTIPNTAVIGALRVGTGAPVMQEVKRQEREFQLVVWAASANARNAMAKPIDVAIALTDWLDLPDGTSGRTIYKGSPYTDFDQKQGIFRRDFILTVEYPTMNFDVAPEVVAIEADFYLNTETAQDIALTDPDLTIFT